MAPSSGGSPPTARPSTRLFPPTAGSWCRPPRGRCPSSGSRGLRLAADRTTMKPTVVIVGRPNVGKSTLFNRLTRSRDALVADLPGLTRDRHYGQGRLGEKPFIVVDTGGDRKSTRLNSSHMSISYAVFCLKKKKKK